jgi:7-cyano-7-deazaguanine tRNA-ribosyltransferase
MMFALAVAMGCDLFDSAAYAIYARDERYLTVRGTKHLEDLSTFPCGCPTCSEYTPEDLRAMADRDAEVKLARHNLHVSFAEMRRIRQAIREGKLLELVDARARGHPTMIDGYRALLAEGDHLDAHDPVSKDTLFVVSGESADWPAIERYQDRLARFDPAGDVLLGGDADAVAGEFDEHWDLRPPFGPVPPELRGTYPLTAEVPDRLDRRAYERAVEGIARLVAASDDAAFTVAPWGWPEAAVRQLPDGVDVRE